jgi:hypothetical protein
MAQVESELYPSPRCQSCAFVMPSYSSTTGLRCGLQYFQCTPLMRKFQRMDKFPEVKDFNACEAWQLHENAE